jgi:hypothetical protein
MRIFICNNRRNMKNRESYTRIDTTGSDEDYPGGQIKDATNKYAEDGTLINQALYQDAHNFFWTCVDKAGIVPNNEFDTAGNSQLFQAVSRGVGNASEWSAAGLNYSSNSNLKAYTKTGNYGPGGIRWRYEDGGRAMRLRGRAEFKTGVPSGTNFFEISLFGAGTPIKEINADRSYITSTITITTGDRDEVVPADVWVVRVAQGTYRFRPSPEYWLWLSDVKIGQWSYKYMDIDAHLIFV